MTTTPGPLTGAPIARSITDRSEIPIPARITQRVDEEEADAAGHRPDLIDHAPDRAMPRTPEPCGGGPHGARAILPARVRSAVAPSGPTARPACGSRSIASARSIARSMRSARSPTATCSFVGGGADELGPLRGAGRVRVTPIDRGLGALAGPRRVGRRDRQRLVGVPRRRPTRARRGRPGAPRPVGGCSSSTTTAATTSRDCAATCRSTAPGAVATGRS